MMNFIKILEKNDKKIDVDLFWKIISGEKLPKDVKDNILSLHKKILTYTMIKKHPKKI